MIAAERNCNPPPLHQNLTWHLIHECGWHANSYNWELAYGAQSWAQNGQIRTCVAEGRETWARLANLLESHLQRNAALLNYGKRGTTHAGMLCACAEVLMCACHNVCLKASAKKMLNNCPRKKSQYHPTYSAIHAPVCRNQLAMFFTMEQQLNW